MHQCDPSICGDCFLRFGFAIALGLYDPHTLCGLFNMSDGLPPLCVAPPVELMDSHAPWSRSIRGNVLALWRCPAGWVGAFLPWGVAPSGGEMDSVILVTPVNSRTMKSHASMHPLELR